MKRYYGFKIFAFIGFVTIAALLAGLVVKFLWNNLMPDIFGLPAITFIQALGLLILSRILFGGFPHKDGKQHPRNRWKKKMKAKWGNMTPEEKVAFRQKMKHWRKKGCWPEEEIEVEVEEKTKGKEDPKDEDLV